jgi:CRP/FNR family transcriptional regulator, transcriptional activator FtrB
VRAEDSAGVRSLPLFADMTDASYAELMRAAFLQRFPTDVTLIQEGDPPDFLHVVVEGIIELFATHAERETTISILRPVSAFILAAVINDQVYLKAARTLDRSRILMIPSENVRGVFQTDTAFARSVVHELALAYRRMVRELKNQKLRSGAERLAAWLIRIHTQQGGTGTVRLAFEKRVLAARLGMTPENLSRAFAALASYGVEVDRRTVRLTELEDLARLAKPNPLMDDYTT